MTNPFPTTILTSNQSTNGGKIMSGRGNRMKVKREGCYYHLMNRAAGCRGEKPFNRVDMEYGFRLLQNLCEYFLIEVISAAWMGNHFHVVVYAPGPDELPSIEDIARRHNNYYSSMLDKFTYAPKQMPKINLANPEICREVGLKMIDISYFMRAFQQRFTVVYNQSRDRIGKLWANKFKSVILDSRNSLEACVLYVELNPVRAGLTTNPADYHFTTWGRYCGTGKHLFQANFVKHLKQNIWHRDTSKWTDNDLFSYFRSEMARIVAAERGASNEEIFEAQELAKRRESMPIHFLRRTRHFSDGAILGSKLFIREMGAKFDNPDRISKKQLSRGLGPAGAVIYCFRKLQS